MLCGYGIYTFKDDYKVYEGQFKDNKMNGQGTMNWKDG